MSRRAIYSAADRARRDGRFVGFISVDKQATPPVGQIFILKARVPKVQEIEDGVIQQKAQEVRIPAIALNVEPKAGDNVILDPTSEVSALPAPDLVFQGLRVSKVQRLFSGEDLVEYHLELES